MQLTQRIFVTATLSMLASLSLAEPGVTDATITLGMSAPLSGPNGAYGVDMRKTVEAYFASINQSGGVHGRKLELVALDDGYETERTVANTRTLIKDKNVFALLSFYGSSPTTEAMNKVFGPAKVPLVGTISGAGTLREPLAANANSRYMFHVRTSYADETAVIVNYLAGLGIARIAVFYQNDGFGKSGLEGVTTALGQHKLAPVAVGTVERNSIDVAKAVEAIAKSNAQAVIMVTLYKPTAAFIMAMKQAGQNPMLMALSPVGTEQLIAELGNTSPRGLGISQVVPYPWSASIPVVREYQKFSAKPGTYSYYGMEGYLMARTMVEGLKRISNKEPTRERLVTALESMNNVDFGGFKVNYSPTARQGSSFVELTVLGANGKLLK
ncbi:MAG: ABC transporter substrate-binding protein [Rhodoferax sp.]|uniref:ABC transporter substrate-binding protein n=1 Tax=Rhodoferax sp. TaxID=50421 RepID=UPI0017C21336|nr:ABC transporter substrate-binding protein [Rhodoferax sp.]NMM18626.1 ABC transporter substrate-binding protein [Rhodoferax sp.]